MFRGHFVTIPVPLDDLSHIISILFFFFIFYDSVSVYLYLFATVSSRSVNLMRQNTKTHYYLKKTWKVNIKWSDATSGDRTSGSYSYRSHLWYDQFQSWFHRRARKHCCLLLNSIVFFLTFITLFLCKTMVSSQLCTWIISMCCHGNKNKM